VTIKGYLGATFCSVLISAGWTVTTARGQTAGATPEAHVAIAKAATYRPGHDFTPLFDQLCAEPKPAPPRPAAQPGAAPPARRIPPRSEWFAEPAKVFDNLYYVGTQIQSMWAVKTSEGIILHDTAFDYTVEEAVDKGFPKVGLDPAQIKYVIIAHAHNDHYLGAKYLQQKYHPRIIMSEADWDVLAKDDTPADLKPKKDMVATDGMKLTLGDTTLTLYITPGHTPGTISTLFPLRDGNQRHLGVLWGGTAVPQTRGYSDDGAESIRLYNASAKRLKEITAKAGVDVLLSSHTNYDKTLDMINAIRFRNPGDPHPFVSKDAVQRWLTIASECTAAQMIWRSRTSSSN
jgi:metallo-beta-lactamase class B